MRRGSNCSTWLGVIAAAALISGCAIAFTPGLDPAPRPPQAPDSAKTPSAAEKIVQAVESSSPPAVGMSFVVGGEPLDAGSLPKPPFPVVLLP